MEPGFYCPICWRPTDAPGVCDECPDNSTPPGRRVPWFDATDLFMIVMGVILLLSLLLAVAQGQRQ